MSVVRERVGWVLLGCLFLLASRPVLQVAAGVIQLGFPADRLRREALDVYEGSVWAVYECMAVCLVGLVGAYGARRLAPASSVARAAVVPALLFAACLVGMSGIHFVLMRRITALTGQTFGGFP